MHEQYVITAGPASVWSYDRTQADEFARELAAKNPSTVVMVSRNGEIIASYCDDPDGHQE